MIARFEHEVADDDESWRSHGTDESEKLKPTINFTSALASKKASYDVSYCFVGYFQHRCRRSHILNGNLAVRRQYIKPYQIVTDLFFMWYW